MTGQSTGSGAGDARPRILCLHGGGVNAQVFELQCRVLIKQLEEFRLVFADGPFLSDPGPGIAAVYGDRGPFRCWLKWGPDVKVKMADETIVNFIRQSIQRCKMQDKGSGPWVGVLGFSQGAKIAASLLYDQQNNTEMGIDLEAENYRFGVLMAGRAPLVSLSPQTSNPAFAQPSQNSADPFEYPSQSPHVLRIPTIHVHGIQDEGLHLHRLLASRYCDPTTSTTIEWNGGHRLPIKTADTTPIVDEIRRVAKQENVLS
ncbi:hypothetical protein Golomagni_06294 [Golovinomyces magnicellulatus]|nr:hypothetical protein Golomagni_06294 [Golovinomyces magnicellulatus]